MIEKMKPRQMGGGWDIDLEEVTTLCQSQQERRMTKTVGCDLEVRKVQVAKETESVKVFEGIFRKVFMSCALHNMPDVYNSCKGAEALNILRS